MTNYAEDSEDDSEEQNLGDEESDEIDLDISNIQKILDELKALKLQLWKGKRPKLLKEKLNLSTTKSNLWKKSLGSSTIKHQQESEKKDVANDCHIDSEDEYDGEESNYENGSDNCKRLNVLIGELSQIVLNGPNLENFLGVYCTKR